MIWIYILVATVISYLLCKKECKRPEYFILMLFPIELYGLNIASVTVKPYMIFGAVVVFLYFKKKRSVQLNKMILLFAVMLLFANLFTGLIVSSVMQHLMFILNLIIVSSVLLYNDCVDLTSLSSVAVATLIGHGVVFFVLSLMFNLNNALPDLLAYERNDFGVYISLRNGIEEEIRMRGFTIDPNGFVVNYVFGGACAMYCALSTKGNTIKNWIAVGCLLFIILQSGSRMGLLCFLLIAVFSIIYTVNVRKVNRNAIIYMGLIIVGLIVYTAIYFDAVSTFFDSYFNDRASLSSDKGRLTIWTSNMQYLIRTGKIWLGVGQDQIAQIGDLHTAFHNTWLEWVGGCGIFIGGFISLWFLRIAIRAVIGLKYCKANQPMCLPVALGYIGTVICISSISNIANVTYIFLAFLMNYHLSNIKPTEGINEFQGTDKKQSIAV